MKSASVYGSALLAGTLASLVTMALHPTGSQLLADVQRMAPVGVAVHTLALAGLPLTFFGTVGLTRLLATGLAAQLPSTVGAQHDLTAALFEYTRRINQAFAKVYVFASSAAILLWSASIVSHRRLARGAGMLGIMVALLVLLAMSVGHLRLDVHGFGAVVLTQGIWMITVGTLMLRLRPPAAPAPNL